MDNPLPDWVPLNWLLISNPINWMIIVLMVLIGAIILCMIGGAIGHANVHQSQQ